MSSLFCRFLPFLISCCGRVVDLCSKVGRCCLVWVHLVISYYPILSFIWVLMIGRLIIINIVDIGHKVVSRGVRGELRSSGQILTKKRSAVYETHRKQIKQTNETTKQTKSKRILSLKWMHNEQSVKATCPSKAPTLCSNQLRPCSKRATSWKMRWVSQTNVRLFQDELPKLQRMPKGYVHKLQVSHLKSFDSFAYSSFEPTGAPHTLNILTSTEDWATNFIMNLRNPSKNVH